MNIENAKTDEKFEEEYLVYYAYTEEELRSICRHSIESLEMWARRLIHEKFIEKYGSTYVEYKTSFDNYLIKKEVREHIKGMLNKEPQRFHRAVDTLFFEHIIYFLCNPKFYCELFSEALKYAYPNGKEEVRTFLNRIIPIRNALSHSNPISVRQAEQAICYSHDFVEGLKAYYKAKGLEQMWNVPRIIRITDSLGNAYDNPTDDSSLGSIFKLDHEFRCGDTYSVNIDVDSSFSDMEYDIIWRNQCIEKSEFNNKTHFTITFDESDIAQGHMIECRIKSHKPWHKYQFYDCQITLVFSVFPPL